MSDPWYPPPGEYYVPPQESDAYPLRQGDLVGPARIGGVSAPLVQIVHPSCELGKASVSRVQVCVVEPLSVLQDDRARASVVAGFSEKQGRVIVAYAHTFFLPGISPDTEGTFADFRRLHLVDRDEVSLHRRRTAMTHDCRVHFIRRWIYFRFRILLSLERVRELEAQRIGADQAFEGTRPSWAPLEP